MTKRMLVVEDQEDLRAILRDFLSASGYTVIEAVDGRERRQGSLRAPRSRATMRYRLNGPFVIAVAELLP
jgi:DNA-binding response OmpR family regulator